MVYLLLTITLHPDSTKQSCRTFEISEYWKILAKNDNTIIGGDWNVGMSCIPFYCWDDSTWEIQQPSNFKINYSNGQHWNIYNDTSEQPTTDYVFGGLLEWLDHEFSNFGSPCTDCGSYYGTDSLQHSSAVGGYNGMPRADGGYGCDHRQILVDIWLTKEK